MFKGKDLAMEGKEERENGMGRLLILWIKWFCNLKLRQLFCSSAQCETNSFCCSSLSTINSRWMKADQAFVNRTVSYAIIHNL
jgi:hypothetical protein